MGLGFLHDRRSRWLVGVPLTLVLTLGVSGCGLLAKEASHWGPDAGKILEESHGAGAIHLGSDAGRTRINQLIRDAPRNPTADEAAKLRQLIELNTFQTAVEGIAAADSARFAQAQTSVVVITTEAGGAEQGEQAFDYMVEKGKELLSETACDVAWQQMVPSDRKDADDLAAGGYRRSAPSTVPDLLSLTGEAAVQAIANSAQEDFLRRFIPGSAVIGWFEYAQGIYEKAEELTSTSGGPLVAPDGSSVTPALIYYARLCMKPPGSA